MAVSPVAELRWKFNSFARRNPKIAGGIAAAIAISGGLSAWALIPTRHERLAEWRENYTELCFTKNEKEPELKSRDVAVRLYDADLALEKIFPMGWMASTQFNGEMNRAVFCFDDLEEGKPPIQHWMIGNINIVDKDYSMASLVEPYLRRELEGYWNDAVDKMDGFWGTKVPNYVIESAMMLNRFQRGIYATEYIDMSYHLQRQFGESVFESPMWKSLLENNYYGKAAASYQSVWSTYDGVADDVTDSRVMKTTMHTIMADTALLQSGDVGFLNNYADYMRDEDTVCEVVGQDEDGNDIEECETVYSSPDSYIHSVHLDTQTIVDLSMLVRNGERPFLTHEDVEEVMNDDRYRDLGKDAQSSFNYAKSLAEYWCYGHNTGKFGTSDLTINYKAAESYYVDALKHEPMNGGFIRTPGF